MRATRLTRALTLTLVLGAAAAALGAEPAVRAADLDSRRHAVGRCALGQVVVRLAGTVSCRPLTLALPQPRNGSERAAILRTLLTSDWGGPPDTKRRRPPTIDGLLADFGPGAAARVRQAAGEIPTIVDRLVGKPRRPSSVTGTSAAAPCGPPPGAPAKTESKRQDLGNGSSFDLHVSIAEGKATAGFGIEGPAKDGSDRRVRWDVDFDLCEENLDFAVPECPTAQGRLDGAGKTSFTLKVTSLKDGSVEHSATVEIKHQATSKGIVAVDAKLDRVEIEDTYLSTLRSSGQGILWGPSSERGTVRRTAWVDMRSGRYDLGRANVVDVQVSYTGVLSLFTQDALARARVAAQLAKESDETFARTVRHVIEEYREREAAWQTPDTCATLEFTPASRTLRLRDGQTGTFRGAIRAKRGGTAQDGRWRRLGQRNVIVGPTRAGGGAPTFSYRVTNADREVSASFRATSPAGVAKGDWVQGGTELPARFVGTFTGENRTAGTNRYSGTIVFVRNATSPAGTVTYRVERVSWRHRFTADTPCVIDATTSVSVVRPDPRLALLVIVRQRTTQGYGYAITGMFTSPRQLTIRVTCNGVASTIPWLPGAALNSGAPGASLNGSGTFTDGRTIRGRYDSTGTSSTYSWNLRGAG